MWDNTDQPDDPAPGDFSDWLTDAGFFAAILLACLILGWLVREILA